jgi:drug/metabolite transporter (DMT)-like permease
MRILKALPTELVVAACGAIYITAWFNLLKLVGLYNSKSSAASLLSIVLPFAVLLLLVAALVRFTEWGSQLSIPFFLVGVAVGVVYDAVTDKTMDRNLFPIEAAFWSGILAVALGFGKELGAWLKKNRQVEVN